MKEMKKILSTVVAVIVVISCTRSNHYSDTAGCGDRINNAYSKKDTLERMLQQYAGLGIPGLVVAVYSPEGYWATAKGFVNVETKKPMDLCKLQYLQSIAKTYMAFAVLKLQEEGRIDLDAPITRYLPARYSKYFDKPETVKVRNLMNHTSGIPEYTDVPEYIAYLLQHPDHSFTSEEFFGYIKNEKQRFIPGSKYAYTNTNYHLLALIADSIAGDHAQLIQQKVLDPLQLRKTFYRNSPGYLKYPELPNSYLDQFGTGNLADVTMMQQVSVACSKGDDGIVSTPSDAIRFMKGLIRGKLLSASSMEQMMTWVNDSEGQPIQGLGLFNVRYSGHTGYGHGGAGIGAGCGLYYFPDRNVYVFLGTNIGTLVDGPIVRKVDELKKKVIEVVLSY
jgi:D-alanyl-D-alanine carboxypeptidase